MPSSQPSSQWRAYLTIDRLVSLLWLPLPVALSLPLLSLAQSPSYSSPTLPYTAGILVFFLSMRCLGALNEWIAYGRPRELDWSEEVVVITGGASGLGRSMAEIFAMRGASVAVLDVKEPEGGEEGIGEGIRWFECDVGSFDAVQGVKAGIEKDVCSFTMFHYNPRSIIPRGDERFLVFDSVLIASSSASRPF